MHYFQGWNTSACLPVCLSLSFPLSLGLSLSVPICLCLRLSLSQLLEAIPVHSGYYAKTHKFLIRWADTV